jgi:hypothetical protein
MTIYVRCIYGMFGREITMYTIIYGVCYMVLANPISKYEKRVLGESCS